MPFVGVGGVTALSFEGHKYLKYQGLFSTLVNSSGLSSTMILSMAPNDRSGPTTGACIALSMLTVYPL